MKKVIPYGRQSINNDDLKAISKTIKSDYLTTGPEVKNFESKIKKFTKSKFVKVCNSGTSALHVAFMSIHINPGDIIIMPAINFIASFNLCKMMKAKIYLSDVDPYTGLMTPNNILNCIKKNNIKKIKAIVTMHLAGKSENIKDFYNLKKKLKCFLIEDACHAFGSEYKYDKKVFRIGCAKHVDLSTFSFHPIKSITTCEGGAITTNNKILAKRVSLLVSHGLIRKNKLKHWDYDIKSPGYNFRLSDLHCALGVSQIKRISSFIKKRENIAKIYNFHFNKHKEIINVPKINKLKCSWHLYIASFKFKNLRVKDSFFKYLKKKGIIIQYHYIPIYKFTVAKGYKELPGSNKYYKNSASLPIFVDLNKKKQLKIIKTILNYFKKIN
tara:strand:- start:466 stop:1617 length:1152 start_codon:yes stop_codon:yes gene_type:complete